MGEKTMSAAPAEHGPSDPNLPEGWKGPDRPRVRARVQTSAAANAEMLQRVKANMKDCSPGYGARFVGALKSLCTLKWG